ncbi:MAG: DUF393 domain-containing protein [Planctomycetota bacterium]
MTAATSPAVRPELTLFIDGLCPLCKREARAIERLDKGRGIVELVDITASDFDPSVHGRTLDDFMGAIHAKLADGRLVTGTEVFRRTYRALGWGWLWAPTGWPVLRPIFDVIYRVFAKIRPRLSGHKVGVASDVSAEACETDRCSPRLKAR